ncbi:SPL family radical SAM protein [Methyloterricola oryzae]|uniref:SPL family radical SAM protein n=1 Tax=Methyloterricola oryzae TaxID=1495050 RepID=UPI0011AFA7A6|nr:radical SAM protein [Methyloterricola oryzae]
MQEKRLRFTTPLTVTSQFPFCSLPLRLDSYRGCAFGCTYCFALYRGGNVPDRRVIPADPYALHKMFRRAQEDSAGLIAEMIRRRVPIHFGGMSDPFQPAELRHRITARFLEAIIEAEYPVVISTKSDAICREPYLSMLRDCKYLICQFSFSSTNDAFSEKVEPHSSPPTKLLAAAEFLAEMKIPVLARWQPYIPGLSESPETFVSRVAQRGIRHVSLEHLKIPVERRHPFSGGNEPEVMIRARMLYQSLSSRRDGREFLLPATQKITTVIRARDACKQAGLSFGAADNEFQFLSDGEACCSGVNQFLGFENVFKYHIGCALKRSVNDKISLDRVANEWRPKNSIDRYLNSRSRLHSRLGVKGTVEDHLKYRWNTDSANGSPTTYYGVERTGNTSPDGDVVYQWSAEAQSLFAQFRMS